MNILRAIFVLYVLVAPASVVSGQECSLLTARYVQKITGTPVKNVPRESQPGAGGTCANFATSDGKMYLVVSESADYKSAVAVVPQSLYPRRDKLADVGDEAVLMRDTTGRLRYLVARKGNHCVILFPFNRSNPSDEQLKQLTVAALSH
jgi:hypothetical protein